MSKPAKTTKIHESFDVHGDLAPQVALDFVFGVDDLSDAGDFIVGEIVCFGVKLNAGLGQDFLGTSAADTVYM